VEFSKTVGESIDESSVVKNLLGEGLEDLVRVEVNLEIGDLPNVVLRSGQSRGLDVEDNADVPHRYPSLMDKRIPWSCIAVINLRVSSTSVIIMKSEAISLWMTL
jgi:hypothetical protein